MNRFLLPLFFLLPLPAVAQNPCAAQALEASNAQENYSFAATRNKSISARLVQMHQQGEKTGPYRASQFCPALRQLNVSTQEFIKAQTVSNLCYLGIGVDIPGAKEHYEELFAKLRADLAKGIEIETDLCLTP